MCCSGAARFARWSCAVAAGGSLVGLRVPSSFARPGPRPGASVVAARLRLFAPCGRLCRPRSRAAPAAPRRALPAVPLPRAGSPFPRVRAGPAPCRPGARGVPIVPLASLAGGMPARVPPCVGGNFLTPSARSYFFFVHQSVNWAKYAPKKRRKTPDFRGSFLLLII